MQNLFCTTVLLIITLLFGTVLGQVNYNTTLIGRWANGPCYAVDVAGNIACFNNGAYLEVVDIADPANPVELGKVLMPSVAEGIAVSGNYAYVADGSDGLRIINITDPTDPIESGYYDTGDFAYDVAVSGNYAYVADGSDGLRIIDISDPTDPIESGYYDTGNFAYDVAVSGNYAYVADGSDGLRIIDISDPTDPIESGYYDTGNFAYDVAVSGNYAYVADGSDGLRIIYISDPTDPTESGYYDTDGASSVAVSGNYAYVADGSAGLRIIYISDPTDPTESGYYDTGYHANDVAVSGNYGYVADEDDGLRIIDITDPTDLIESGCYDTGSMARGVVISGNYAYVADFFDGLRIIDISDPTDPIESGYYDTGDFAYDVAVSGNYAYVADGRDGLCIIDISDPTNPIESGYYDTGSYAWGVAVSGNYAYVADDSDGLRIIDISDPTNPIESGHWDDTNTVAHRVVVSGNYAYVANFLDGLRIINITDPTDPIESGYYDTGNLAYDVAVSGNYAYVADGSDGLRIINISDPTDPTESGYYDTDSYAWGVVVSGNYAYVADAYDGLRIIDISDPTNPTESGYYDTGSLARDVAVSGNYAYVADERDGLYIIQFINEHTEFVVNSTGDLGDSNPGDGICDDGNGYCTLRAALEEANAYTGTNRITFNIPSGQQTIQPGAPLPVITEPVIIDATTQPGFDGVPLIELDGSNAGVEKNGLEIVCGYSTVRGMIINNFNAAGIFIHTEGGNLIAGNYLGPDATGTSAQGNHLAGVQIHSNNNIVGGSDDNDRNILSGNDLNGVILGGDEAYGNIVRGNYIGLKADGLGACPNDNMGIKIIGGKNNTIGGLETGERNVISGNIGHGILIQTADYSSGIGKENVVLGNYIGTDYTGMYAVPNQWGGISLLNAPDNVIGPGNVISGNISSGIFIWKDENSVSISMNNVVKGNYIGTNATGTDTIPNRDGVLIGHAPENTVGGTSTSDRNIISGNNRFGVGIFWVESEFNLIKGNYIGTNKEGTHRLPNGTSQSNNSGGGVFIYDARNDSLVDNLISGNSGSGVIIAGNATNSVVKTNKIGSNAEGDAALPNLKHGVQIGGSDGTAGNRSRIVDNLIAYNDSNGVAVEWGVQNRITWNTMIENDIMKIDLYENGVSGPTPNDIDDPDYGSNFLQNYPYIEALGIDDNGNLIMKYYVDSDPLYVFYYPLTIEFFKIIIYPKSSIPFASDQYTVNDYRDYKNNNRLKLINLGPATDLQIFDGDTIEATATDLLGNTSEYSDYGRLWNLTVLDQRSLSIPEQFSLHQNYPNPFNPITTIQYELPQRSDVQITIYNLLGRKVTTLLSETQDAGYKSVIWDASNVTSGMYFYQIRVNDPDAIGAGDPSTSLGQCVVQTKKMILLK